MKAFPPPDGMNNRDGGGRRRTALIRFKWVKQWKAATELVTMGIGKVRIGELKNWK
jgi:hypothetical protein